MAHPGYSDHGRDGPKKQNWHLSSPIEQRVIAPRVPRRPLRQRWGKPLVPPWQIREHRDDEGRLPVLQRGLDDQRIAAGFSHCHCGEQPHACPHAGRSGDNHPGFISWIQSGPAGILVPRVGIQG